MSTAFCPGAANIKGTPTLEIKKCPQCGAEIEIFSSDTQAVCPNCGKVIYNDIQSCFRWCVYAKQCLGEERYDALMAMDREKNNGRDQ